MACIVIAMSPRTGRPKLENPRTEIRRVRLSRDEDALISAAADDSGQVIGEYMREVVLTAAVRAQRRRARASS